jgi:hypothetical protein
MRLRIEVTKSSRTAASSQLGAFETSTTIDAPSMTSASPSPVRVLTPEPGDANLRASRPQLRTSLDAMSPVLPVTTIFGLHLALFGRGIWPRRYLDALPTLDNRTHAPLTVSALVAECRLNGVHYRLAGARTRLETSVLVLNCLPIAPRSGPPGVSPVGVQVEGVTMANNVAQTKG